MTDLALPEPRTLTNRELGLIRKYRLNEIEVAQAWYALQDLAESVIDRDPTTREITGISSTAPESARRAARTYLDLVAGHHRRGSHRYATTLA